MIRLFLIFDILIKVLASSTFLLRSLSQDFLTSTSGTVFRESCNIFRRLIVRLLPKQTHKYDGANTFRIGTSRTAHQTPA